MARFYSVPDFLRLRAEFGVDWVVLAAPGVDGIAVPLPEFAGDGLPGGVMSRVELRA